MSAKDIASRTKYVENNAIWELLYNIFAAIFPFIIRPLMIRYLGVDYLGLNSLFTSILSVVNVANLGIESAFVYYLYEPIAKKDIAKIGMLLNLYRKIFVGIGSIILAIGVIITPFLRFFISGDVPTDVNIYIVFLLFLSSTVISYWEIPYLRIVFWADQHNDYCSKITIVNFIIIYGLQMLAIVNRQYYLYVLVQFLCTVFNIFQYRWVYRNKYPDYVCRGKIDSSFISKLKKKVFSVAIYRVRDISRDSLGSVILSSFLGLGQLAVYQNYFMILTVPNMLRAIITNALTHSLGNYNVTESKEKVYEVYKIALFITMIISGWFAIGYFNLVQDFMYIWMGAEYVLPDSVIGSFTVYLYVIGFCDMAKMMRTVTGIWEKGRMRAFFEIIINLILNILLTRYLGMLGIVAATVITIICIYIPCEMKIIIKGYFEESYTYSLLLYLKNFVWLLGTTVLVCVVNRYIPQIHFWRLVMETGVCVIIPIITIFLFYYRNSEMKYIKQSLSHLLGTKQLQSKA